MKVRAAVLAVLAAAVCGCESGTKAGVDPAVGKAVAKTRAAHPDLFRRKIVLLGFDSCDPDLVDQYVKEGKLPHFARLRREGAHGALASLQPTLSPVVWTTIATGVTPQRHGILDFVTETPAGKVPVTSKMRQADTVWDLLSGQGEKVGVVGWLVTFPAEKVNGFLVSEHMGHLAYEYLFGQRAAEEEHRTWPEDLAGRLKDEVVGPDDISLGKMRSFLDISEKEYRDSYSTTFDPRNRVGNLRLTLATAEMYRNIGERLDLEEKPRFFACYFEAMDAISHLFMPYAPPKTPNVPTDLYLKYRNAIEANYIWHDRVLGEYMDQADADTTLLVVSDHGFKNGDYRTADGSEFHEKTGAMWHRHYGVFYAWGNGIKRGATVAGASVYDVAPTILASMGYPVPEEMPGRVLDDAFVEPPPVETVPTYRGEARRDEMAKLKAEENAGGEKPRTPEEEDSLKRLESLGYVSGDRSDPDNASLNLGSAMMSQGRYEQAYKEFKKLLDAGRRGPNVLDAIAGASLRTGRLDEAQTYIAESLTKDPNGVAPRLVRAQLLLTKAKFAEAEESVRDALRIKSDTPQCWGMLAEVLDHRLSEALSRHDDAAAHKLRQSIIEAYESSLRLEPRQMEALFELARTRLSEVTPIPEVEKARDELDRVLEMNPLHVTALNNRVAALLRLALNALSEGRAEEAERLLPEALANAEKAISTAADRYGPDYPGYAKGWANKAYVFWLMGRIDDATAAAAKARSIDPAYEFGQLFLSAMARTGHPIAPPAPAAPAPTPGVPVSSPAPLQEPSPAPGK